MFGGTHPFRGVWVTMLDRTNRPKELIFLKIFRSWSVLHLWRDERSRLSLEDACYSMSRTLKLGIADLWSCGLSGDSIEDFGWHMDKSEREYMEVSPDRWR